MNYVPEISIFAELQSSRHFSRNDVTGGSQYMKMGVSHQKLKLCNREMKPFLTLSLKNETKVMLLWTFLTVLLTMIGCRPRCFVNVDKASMSLNGSDGISLTKPLLKRTLSSFFFSCALGVTMSIRLQSVSPPQLQHNWYTNVSSQQSLTTFVSSRTIFRNNVLKFSASSNFFSIHIHFHILLLSSSLWEWHLSQMYSQNPRNNMHFLKGNTYIHRTMPLFGFLI